MQFNSIGFLFCFLPLFLTLYAVFPWGKRHVPLLLGSLIFYTFSSSGNYWWVALLVACTVLTYLAGLTLRKTGRGALLGLYLLGMAAALIFFKLWQGGKYLPAGMSFYLFQMAAYLIDVYRQRMAPEKNILAFGAQMTMFPKLLSGPIVSPAQLQQRPSGQLLHNIRDGLESLILGLGMKVLLANRLGGLWAQAAVLGYESVSTPGMWLALLAYAMQLYFDFYGYSLMAIGLGKMLGYDLPANFAHPYGSRSVSEFYRRWHITLGAWFREYLYIPLGGNRKGFCRTILNLAVVWLFTGLWHGVGGNYLLWAGFLFLMVINERLWLRKILRKSALLAHVYLVFVILLSWVPFAVGDWDQMVIFLGRLFGFWGKALNPLDYLEWGGSYMGILLPGVLLMTPYPEKLWKRIRNTTLSDVLLFALFWAVVYFIATAAQDPFLYFQY